MIKIVRPKVLLLLVISNESFTTAIDLQLINAISKLFNIFLFILSLVLKIKLTTLTNIKFKIIIEKTIIE